MPNLNQIISCRQALTEMFPTLSYSEGFINHIDLYCGWLKKWNAIVNLTAVKDDAEIWLKHVGDSIAGSRFLPDSLSEVGDFGSGAGIPGIFLALLFPDTNIHSFDSSLKKIEFQLYCKEQLTLKNFHPVKMNLKTPDRSYLKKMDAVVTRAFTETETVLTYAYPLLQKNGAVYLWKSHSQLEPAGDLIHFSLQQEHHYDIRYKNALFTGKIVEYRSAPDA